MAQYDLTTKIVPFLDRHLCFPLLLNSSLAKLYKPEDLAKSVYELAKSTDLVDFAIGLHAQAYPDEPSPEAEFAQKRETMMTDIARLEQEAQAVLHVIENPDVVQNLKQDKMQNLQYLKDTFSLTLEQIEALYYFGQLQYSVGNYSLAADYLYHFRILSTNTQLVIASQWGKLASDLLALNWDSALEELTGLRETIDTSTNSNILSPSTSGSEDEASNVVNNPAVGHLLSRTWLIHWSLFVFFQHPEGRTHLLELLLSTAYLNTIQTSCPWVLRYLAAAAILSRKSTAAGSTPVSRTVRNALPTIVKILQTESYQYSDPLTSFLTELYVQFDFDEARKMLETAESDVLDTDFFLSEFKDEIVESSRIILGEAYIRIHQNIDIADLSSRLLNMPQADAEKWIVNLIRDTRSNSDAKIDLEKNVVTTNRTHSNVYMEVIEKTRGLARRTQDLSIDMNKRIAAASQATAHQNGNAQGQTNGVVIGGKSDKKAVAAR